ncbi:conserved hypothetical protein [Rippkaea orientalis PCC 8801]|uniref:Heterocyst frequency control protein PatD n=1 Tax=Rippkaea orientalis (strain PCC 8801 / RF-1) TaxID=41431 RepID=B7K4M4_RIPO1|nr:heterocyst frequency control protein PatD [Rippkaea orientalis]ACK65489.1 conserved hypothetical protein [Rippkaea orientalis PCC 8801]
MLPKFSQESYLNFLVVLTKLQGQVGANDVNLAKLSENLQELQGIFQEQILGSTLEGLDSSLTSVFQSTQTEIQRNLRLLATDLLFLQSARQQKTKEQRLGVMCDRIEQLISYSQIILERLGEI